MSYTTLYKKPDRNLPRVKVIIYVVVQFYPWFQFYFPSF